jgi:hypothetical protein
MAVGNRKRRLHQQWMWIATQDIAIQVLVGLEAVGVRSYISESDRGRRNWRAQKRRVSQPTAELAAHGARACCVSAGNSSTGRLPIRYETGAMRRIYLRGDHNILKRILLQAAALNRGLLRTLFGVGTPRSLQSRVAALFVAVWVVRTALRNTLGAAVALVSTDNIDYRRTDFF